MYAHRYMKKHFAVHTAKVGRPLKKEFGEEILNDSADCVIGGFKSIEEQNDHTYLS